jgi:hypothetical protein
VTDQINSVTTLENVKANQIQFSSKRFMEEYKYEHQYFVKMPTSTPEEQQEVLNHYHVTEICPTNVQNFVLCFTWFCANATGVCNQMLCQEQSIVPYPLHIFCHPVDTQN